VQSLQRQWQRLSYYLPPVTSPTNQLSIIYHTAHHPPPSYHNSHHHHYYKRGILTNVLKIQRLSSEAPFILFVFNLVLFVLPCFFFLSERASSFKQIIGSYHWGACGVFSFSFDFFFSFFNSERLAIGDYWHRGSAIRVVFFFWIGLNWLGDGIGGGFSFEFYLTKAWDGVLYIFSFFVFFFGLLF
jgi:hypothetical protein